MTRLGINNVAYVACWSWLGHDPAAWPAFFPPIADRARLKVLLKDPVAWAKACPNQLGVVVRDAVAVCGAESGYETRATHRSASGESTGNEDLGLWQISNRWQYPLLAEHPHWDDPYENGFMAQAVWRDSGGGSFTPWSVYANRRDAAGKEIPDSALYLAHRLDAAIALVAPLPPSEWPDPAFSADVAAKLDEILTVVTTPYEPQWLNDDLETIQLRIAEIRAKFS